LSFIVSVISSPPGSHRAGNTLTLVHGDLHLRNIVVSDFDGEILAALDWELATLGDPIADLGTTLAYWPENDETVLPEFRALLLPGYPRRADLVERYCLITGRDVADAELAFWHALALWKVAIIAEGICAVRKKIHASVPNPASLFTRL
jgi:aminoglycoside phosphotransferase (APT) family kinase protein